MSCALLPGSILKSQFSKSHKNLHDRDDACPRGVHPWRAWRAHNVRTRKIRMRQFKIPPRKTWTHPVPEKVRSGSGGTKKLKRVDFQKWQTPITIQFYFSFFNFVLKRPFEHFIFTSKSKIFLERAKITFFKNDQKLKKISFLKKIFSFENPFYFPCIFLHFREKKYFSENHFFQSSKTVKKT